MQQKKKKNHVNAVNTTDHLFVLTEMPEWSTDGDMDEVGTFDSSGAFVATHMKPPPKVRSSC